MKILEKLGFIDVCGNSVRQVGEESVVFHENKRLIEERDRKDATTHEFVIVLVCHAELRMESEISH